MEQVKVALEVVSPVFLIIAIGYFLRIKNVLNEDFIKIAMKIVFNICLPGLLFLKVSVADVDMILSGNSLQFSAFVFVLTIIMFFISKGLAKLFVRKESRGAFVQGSFRSNYIIIGYSIAFSLLGDQIINRMAMLVVVVVPLYNILSIWVLSENHDTSFRENFVDIVRKIITNPLIIGIALGMIVALMDFKLPIIVKNTISSLGSIGTPLGLLGIGGYFTLENLKSIKTSVISASLKIMIYPFIAVLLAYMLGFNYVDATILFVIFGSPSAISSFIMATALDADSQTAANIVILSTGFSLFTYIIGLSLIATAYGI